MNRFVVILLLLIAAGVRAQDFGSSAPNKTPRPFTPNVSSATRQGGDTIADAVDIPGLPYEITGTTTGFNDDYDEVCPYDSSTSPDVVYRFTPAAAMEIDIDMLGSLYDTKIYLYDTDLNLVACNDDYYPDYVSALFHLPVDPALAPYYLVIDGYGGEHGEYVLSLKEYVYVPCDLDGYYQVYEDEPPLQDEYVDAYNGGCNSPEFGHPFQAIGPGFPADLFTFGGRSGWYWYAGSNYRDTDWFTAQLDLDGHIRIRIDAEAESRLFQLGPLDCDSVGVLQEVIAGPCAPAQMDIYGDPFEPIWLWVGPATYEPPADFEGNEYDYELEITNFQWPLCSLGANDDYTFPAPQIVYPQTWLDVNPSPANIDDVDLSELCGDAPTPGPDLFARLYLGAGDQVGGWLLPMYVQPAAAKTDLRDPWMCLSLVSDLRYPDATCLGVACATGYNQHFSFTPPTESGWYFLVADHATADPPHSWAEIWRNPTPPPAPPAHDTCAGATVIAPGPIAVIDELTDCTNAVDPGRDGCNGQRDLAYTSRDAIFRIDFTAGQVLDVTMLGEGDWEEALYLVRDCENPLGNCVESAVPAGDGVRLQYVALDDETLWLVCDSWGLGPRPYTLTGILDQMTDAPPPAPSILALHTAPNPFNPTTTLTYDLPRAAHARLRIYALDGRLVDTIVDAPREPGRHTVTWHARDRHDRTLPSGTYLARLESAGEIRTTRLTLLK